MNIQRKYVRSRRCSANCAPTSRARSHRLAWCDGSEHSQKALQLFLQLLAHIHNCNQHAEFLTTYFTLKRLDGKHEAGSRGGRPKVRL